MISEKEYENGLNKFHNNEKNASASKNVLQFYNDNKPYCEYALSYYEDYKSHKNNFVKAPESINEREFKSSKLSGSVILIITANPIEEGVLLHKLSEYYKMKIPSYFVHGRVYQVINQTKYTIIHSHANRTGDEFTRRAINYASKIFKIDYILLLGICYGINYQKQQLCSVIISNDVRGFRINFRDNDDTDNIEFEAESEFVETPNDTLIGVIDSLFNYYQPINDDFSSPNISVNVNIKTGKILSSNSLMSSKRVKDSIIASLGHDKPQPLAGEMEACGIFKSNIFFDEKFDKWLVIKSACSMLSTWYVFKTLIEMDNIFYGSEGENE